MVNVYVLAFLCTGNTNDTILLVRRCENQSFGSGLYSIVGGKVEEGETVEHAVIREVLEETGLQVEIKEKLQIIHEEGIQNGIEFNYDNTAFLVKPITRNYRKQEDEVSEILVFNINNIPELAFRQTEIVKSFLFNESIKLLSRDIYG